MTERSNPMNKTTKTNNDNYHLLIKQISSAVSEAKKRVATTINNALVETYWNMSRTPLFFPATTALICVFFCYSGCYVIQIR